MIPPDSSNLGVPAEPGETKESYRNAIVLWLVALSLALLILPFYLVAAALRDDVASLEADLQSSQQALADSGTLSPDAQGLMARLTETETLISEVDEARHGILADHANWSAVMAAIGFNDPSQLALTSLSSLDHQITLNGEAADDSAVMRYARNLEESNLFSRVVVESINTIPMPRALATPTHTNGTLPETLPTPTETITPTAKGTATLSPADDYETDDFSPGIIALGQPQSHSFYPVYDVDQLKFLAKAGRHYRVFTFDLTAGVDTFLTISFSGLTYTNDDRSAGDLSSEVMFQVGAGYDVEATIRVTNRGQYGPDRRYQITVEEVPPSPTSTPATSTPTLVPADTPTPTPDLRDAYEPDGDPQHIAVGQTQMHNFFPAGDIDKVDFLAKAGRYYRVSTSQLALGTDTYLVVDVGEHVYTSDDRRPGDLSSEVEFRVGSNDRQTVVEIANHGQFASDMWYQITVEELVTTPTVTPTSTPSPPNTGTPTPTNTPTPTPDLRDTYEPDDVDAGSMAAGETQSHSFYPDGDIDKIRFLAKARRHYWVYTSGLTAGIDTFLTIGVDGATYTNDDRLPGDLSSEIVFYVGSALDVDALLTLTNRGRYGPQQWYDITVQEMIITPTPTGTDTPTATAQPNNTPTPDHTSTATYAPTTMSPSSRIPGLTLVKYTFDSAHESSGELVARPEIGLPRVVSGWERGKGHGALASQAVEFVIILELKVGKP